MNIEPRLISQKAQCEPSSFFLFSFSHSLPFDSIQRLLEPRIRPFHLKHQLPRLPLRQLLLRPHRIKLNQPTDNLSPAFEIAIRDRVHALDQLRKQGVQRVFGEHVQFQGVEEGDEVFGGEQDLGAGCAGGGSRVGGGGVGVGGGAGGVVRGGGVGDCGGEVDAETFGGAGAFDLWVLGRSGAGMLIVRGKMGCDGMGGGSYIPFAFEGLEIYEHSGDGVVTQIRFVLLQ